MIRKTLLLTSTLAVLSALPQAADARRGGGMHGQKLLLVAQTEYLAADGGTLALCHLIDQWALFGFLPLFAEMDGYALSDADCEGDSYYEFTREDMIEAQGAGLVDANLPVDPSRPIGDRLRSMWGTFALCAVVLVVGGKKIAGGGGGAAGARGRANRADPLLQATVLVMSHVAKADGKLDQEELRLLTSIISESVGGTVPIERIIQAISSVNPGNLQNDLKALRKLKLDQAARETLLERAVAMAKADGNFDDSELGLIMQISDALKISADRRNAILG